MKAVYTTIAAALLSVGALAQTHNINPTFGIGAYVESYYSYDFDQPASGNRPSFLYSHNRHNEFNLNLGFIRSAISDTGFRANLALMTGTYANANLAAEPGVLKNIFEANAGVRLTKKKNLWLDAGIFASHIGFESAIGKDCWNLSRSILAENSPYYESGVKLTYTSDNSKVMLSGLVLNGWQRINRVSGNSIPSFGTQIYVKPNDNITLNSSSFIGTDKPDSAQIMRYFHNFYGIFQVTPDLGVIVGFDAGFEQITMDSSGYNTWYSPVLIARVNLTNKLALAGRAEYYVDKNGVIIATGTPNGFQTIGYSVNLDYAVSNNCLWRIEARGFNSKDAIFMRNDLPQNTNFGVTTSLAVSF
jgi:hypothetical protein